MSAKNLEILKASSSHAGKKRPDTQRKMMEEKNDNLEMILYSNIVFECETCLLFSCYVIKIQIEEENSCDKTKLSSCGWLEKAKERLLFEKKKKNNPSLGSATSKRARFDIWRPILFADHV